MLVRPSILPQYAFDSVQVIGGVSGSSDADHAGIDVLHTRVDFVVAKIAI